MRIRWKFWKRPVSLERMAELQRLVDEAEDGAMIPMTMAEIKMLRLHHKSHLDAMLKQEDVYGRIARRIRKDIRNES